MSHRAYNFNAGPGPIPEQVLQQAQKEMFNFQHAGAAVMELSHRSSLYESIHFAALKQIREILSVPDSFDILFLQGGATLQFSMTAKNFLPEGKKAGFVLSGSWSEKAMKEASFFGEVTEIASTKSNEYRSIPEVNLREQDTDCAYIHLTSNNTIYGTQWKTLPEKGTKPVIIDMSSDILSRPVNWEHIDLAYAGAQKNAGMAGVTIVIARRSFLESAEGNVPPSLSYKQHADKDSLYHTPPTGAVYITKLVTDWIQDLGGIKAVEERAEKKASMLYETIDQSEGYYTGHAEKSARSLMNVTFRLPSEELEEKFLQEAKEAGFMGLNGHRSVGGCRASIYNAVPVEHVEALCRFMKQFQHTN
ncbi:3-phosphoserine/phosphohydroxythreonine transaminase [Alkalicoccus urumqiensis]|uniref:Phosphoserine aminotransferase n=1 Tax=Alkalicoccus urumqiensis TaxID=1548213 RepID=A0A2P6MFD3_ALKUR|nr:3-phosphoserine/phosphohydroxythreonine transaminase [Alkalicoccus urumqiensis]PRO64986.1 3-phosphoserine/phosphohydroxythreonine transaminase [Alkalicoccus urumqiensis]